MALSVLVYCGYSVHGADARQHALANLRRSRCEPGCRAHLHMLLRVMTRRGASLNARRTACTRMKGVLQLAI